jgi:hypothetical protein
MYIYNQIIVQYSVVDGSHLTIYMVYVRDSWRCMCTMYHIRGRYPCGGLPAIPVLAHGLTATPVLAHRLPGTPVLAHGLTSIPMMAHGLTGTPVLAHGLPGTPVLAHRLTSIPMLAHRLTGTPVLAHGLYNRYPCFGPRNNWYLHFSPWTNILAAKPRRHSSWHVIGYIRVLSKRFHAVYWPLTFYRCKSRCYSYLVSMWNSHMELGENYMPAWPTDASQ